MSDGRAQANGVSSNGHAGAANGHAASTKEAGTLSSQLYKDPINQRNTKELTDNHGQGVPDNDHSLTVGARGPILLEDSHLLEKTAQFNRERIPERVVHARGMSAKGYFEVTSDITDICAADLFSEVGKRTDVAVRFSTVVHERGSPESLRDVRGFSVKWYTKDGNWDMVGNNLPVFFVRSAHKFTDLNHALKPNPVTGIQEGWRILDFLTHHPESTHILSWLLDQNGIPKNWRKTEGHSVNTYTFINKEGKETLVKWHFLPVGGAEFMWDDEAQMAGSENTRHSHATLDLVENIRNGNPPVWKFYIQTIEMDDQENYDFDPLDATKIWPEDKFPLHEVAKMTLDTPISNMFAENEQIAFSPSNLVPGIGVSNDKLLHGRLHSYPDAQRYRLGVNWQLLPVNAPKWPYHANQNEGAMNFTLKDEEVNYWPSNVEHVGEVNSSKPANVSKEVLQGQKVRQDLPKSKEDPQYDFRQAGERWRTEISKNEKRADEFITHIVGWLSMPKCNDKIRSTWLGYWSKVDKDLGQRVETALNKAVKSS